jgi:hypothetical protein
MIDTIKISHLYLKMPCPEELKQHGWQILYGENTGGHSSWFYKEKKGDGNPYLSLFVAPDGKTYQSATVSIPSFIFGSNVRLPNQSEITEGLDLISEYVTEKSGLEFNAHTATVWEVHFTKDYFVSEAAMQRTLSKLSEMNIPRFDKGGYSDTTLYFHSKGTGKQAQKPRTICIYDKHAERLKKSSSQDYIRQAEGIMRLEFRYNTTGAVKRFVKTLSLPNREAHTIFSQTVSDAVLAPVERQILLLLEETDTQNPVISLTRAYGKRRTATLIQFLFYQNHFGTDFYKIKSLGFSRSAYYDCQKDCRQIGIVNIFGAPKTKIQVDDVS